MTGLLRLLLYSLRIHKKSKINCSMAESDHNQYNLIPRVLRLFGQRLVARRDSGVVAFYYCRISVVKQYKEKPIKKSNFF